MTTTQLFSGLNEDTRNSSRVLRPPGGASSNIFGGGDEEPAKPTRPAATSNPTVPSDNPFEQRLSEQPTYHDKLKQGDSKANIFGVQTESVQSAPRHARPAASSSEPAAPPTETPQQGDGRGDQKESVNPITGEVTPAGGKKPSTRVRQPPGGASSGLW